MELKGYSKTLASWEEEPSLETKCVFVVLFGPDPEVEPRPPRDGANAGKVLLRVQLSLVCASELLKTLLLAPSRVKGKLKMSKRG